ncbi:hypothetical protein SteCoe_24550 [Stentor coeruleus]|uniref:Uncharacterized protein n=1 Tax=Stentor coeruleus TaxID=5963 RepID=A0A1R2BHD8_9CILI|nr:hypothetical protein SteCoe_24550 [Stentor coeruleus]
MRPFKKLSNLDQKPYTDSIAFHTDKLVEESMNSDLSFNKDESYTISNLKHDWESIKVLQDDIKNTSEKLKILGSLHVRPLSECSQIPKVEKKSKASSQTKEFKKLQDKCNELSTLIVKYEKEKKDLVNTNLQLRDDLQQATSLNTDLKKQISTFTSQNMQKKSSEIMKYAQFITRKLKDIPKWEDIFLERNLSVNTYLNMIKTQRFEDCLLGTLQFLSDVVVYCSKTENNINPISFIQDNEKCGLTCEDSENLLITINAQSERIAKLNKQISEAMITSKELLFSPLATVSRRARTSESSCYTPNKNLNKSIFSNNESWVFRRESIQETSPDEEISGKHQDFEN